MCAKFIAGNLVACHSSGKRDVAIIKSGNALMNGAQKDLQKKKERDGMELQMG